MGGWGGWGHLGMLVLGMLVLGVGLLGGGLLPLVGRLQGLLLNRLLCATGQPLSTR